MIESDEQLVDAAVALQRGKLDVACRKLRTFLQATCVFSKVWVPGNAMAGTTIELSEKIVVDPILLSLILWLIDRLDPEGNGEHKLVVKRRSKGRPKNSVKRRNQRLD